MQIRASSQRRAALLRSAHWRPQSLALPRRSRACAGRSQRGCAGSHAGRRAHQRMRRLPSRHQRGDDRRVDGRALRWRPRPARPAMAYGSGSHLRRRSVDRDSTGAGSSPRRVRAGSSERSPPICRGAQLRMRRRTSSGTSRTSRPIGSDAERDCATSRGKGETGIWRQVAAARRRLDAPAAARRRRAGIGSRRSSTARATASSAGVGPDHG